MWVEVCWRRTSSQVPHTTTSATMPSGEHGDYQCASELSRNLTIRTTGAELSQEVSRNLMEGGRTGVGGGGTNTTVRILAAESDKRALCHSRSAAIVGQQLRESGRFAPTICCHPPDIPSTRNTMNCSTQPDPLNNRAGVMVRLVRSGSIAFAVWAAAACTVRADDQDLWRTASPPHGDIDSYGGEADSTVVVVMAPSDCVACNSALGDWILWGSSGRNRALVMLFSSRPTEAEQRTLAATRIKPRAVLPEGSPSVRSDVAVYAFVRGELRDSAVGQRGSLALLARIQGTRPQKE